MSGSSGHPARSWPYEILPRRLLGLGDRLVSRLDSFDPSDDPSELERLFDTTVIELLRSALSNLKGSAKVLEARLSRSAHATLRASLEADLLAVWLLGAPEERLARVATYRLASLRAVETAMGVRAVQTEALDELIVFARKSDLHPKLNKHGLVCGFGDVSKVPSAAEIARTYPVFLDDGLDISTRRLYSILSAGAHSEMWRTEVGRGSGGDWLLAPTIAWVARTNVTVFDQCQKHFGLSAVSPQPWCRSMLDQISEPVRDIMARIAVVASEAPEERASLPTQA